MECLLKVETSGSSPAFFALSIFDRHCIKYDICTVLMLEQSWEFRS